MGKVNIKMTLCLFVTFFCVFNIHYLFAESVNGNKGEFCFLNSENKIITVELKENDIEQSSCLRVFSEQHGELLSINIGSLKFFLTPYITKLTELDSQVIFIPYLCASGTGYGYYEWCVVTAESNKAQYHHLGLLRYHSVSRYSHIFEINPSLTGPGFNFRMDINDAKSNEVIEGSLILKVHKDGEFVKFQLMPRYERDAMACLQLCKNKISSISEWSEERLETIVPDAVKSYRISRNEASLELLKKSIISYYEN